MGPEPRKQLSADLSDQKAEEAGAFARVMGAVIRKLRSEIFLFLLAVLLLLVPILASAARLGSQPTRLVLWLVGGLALLGVAAYLVREVLVESKTKISPPSSTTVPDSQPKPRAPKAARASGGPKTPAPLAKKLALFEIMKTRFDKEELVTLCTYAGVSFDGLRGEGLEAKARELVEYFDRRQQLDELIQLIHTHRPDIQV